MTASLSPVDYNAMGASGYSSGPSESAKSPLSMSLGFLKSLTEKKTTRVDGQQPKRRGPKPDSKPAMTRRQELNRQAQRTHRERKELYIKGLEVEVLRLKENFSAVSQSRDTLAAENQQLKNLLAQHGIQWTGSGGVDELAQNPSLGYSSSGSPSASYGPASTNTSPPPQNGGGYMPQPLNGFQPVNGANDVNGTRTLHNPNGIDLDQAGIDFVLTLERPCMDHIQYLMDRAAEPEGDPCGHALMATCPPDFTPRPEEELSDIPFGHNLPVEEGNPQKTWDLSKGDLANLLDLSKRLNLDGEITPVMAWGAILGHPQFHEFGVDDFKAIAADLLPKVRCYGFGAVLEEFEVKDAIENSLSLKAF